MDFKSSKKKPAEGSCRKWRSLVERGYPAVEINKTTPINHIIETSTRQKTES
jgi:hypothetical protein